MGTCNKDTPPNLWNIPMVRMRSFDKFRFIGLFRYSSVIASQCAHWRGNPPNIPETLGDCHVGLRPPRNDELFGEQFVKSKFASPILKKILN